MSDSNHSVTPPVDGGRGRHSTGLTAEQRRRRARSAAHASWANTTDRAGPGTAAFLDRFERQVDPDGVLPAEIRAVMARHARIAYMLQLAERSAAARRRRANEDA